MRRRCAPWHLAARENHRQRDERTRDDGYGGDTAGLATGLGQGGAKRRAWWQLGFASLALACVLGSSGYFGGWIATALERRGEYTLRGSGGSLPDERALTEAVRSFSSALAHAPLSRRHRLDLESAIERALPILGADRIAAAAPAAALPRIVIGSALNRHKEFAAARRLFSTVARPTEAELAMLTTWQLREAGFTSARAERCAEALPFLEAAAPRLGDPRDVELELGRCLIRVGEPARAVPILGGLVARAENARWPRLFLGEAELGLGHTVAAEGLSRSLVEEFPDFYYGWNLRGQVLERLGQRREAADSYERALGIRPTNTWLRNRIARLRAL